MICESSDGDSLLAWMGDCLICLVTLLARVVHVRPTLFRAPIGSGSTPDQQICCRYNSRTTTQCICGSCLVLASYSACMRKILTIMVSAQVLSGMFSSTTGRIDDRWQRFMKFQIARARQCFADAEAGVDNLDTDARWPVWSALILYRCAPLSTPPYSPLATRRHDQSATSFLHVEKFAV